MKNSFINLLLIILLCSGCSFNKYTMLIGEIPTILKVELDNLDSSKINYVFTSSSMNSNYMYKLIANDTSLYFNDKIEMKDTSRSPKLYHIPRLDFGLLNVRSPSLKNNKTINNAKNNLFKKFSTVPLQKC